MISSLQRAARQLYIALGQLMGAAAALAVDTCALEGIDPAAYTEILGLKGSGYELQVPAFVETGEKIEIDTRTHEYRKRV